MILQLSVLAAACSIPGSFDELVDGVQYAYTYTTSHTHTTSHTNHTNGFAAHGSGRADSVAAYYSLCYSASSFPQSPLLPALPEVLRHGRMQELQIAHTAATMSSSGKDVNTTTKLRGVFGLA